MSIAGRKVEVRLEGNERERETIGTWELLQDAV